MHSIVDLYEKASQSAACRKSFLAGLRMGWIATRDMDVIHQIHERRDYDTISCGVLDDMLAGLALAHKGKKDL